MKRKKKIAYFFALLFLVITILSCGDARTRHVASPRKAEAQAIADSLKSLEQYPEYIQKYKNLGDKDAELVIRMAYGKCLRDRSLFKAAIIQHDSCIALAKEICDTFEIVNALNNQGTNYRRIGSMSEASTAHYEALNLCAVFSDDTSFAARKNVTRALNGLGNVFLSLENFEPAESMFRRALSYETDARNPIGIAINLANLGSVKERQNKTDSALIYYKQSLEYNKSAHNDIGISLCYMYLGKLEEKKHNDEDALKYFRMSYEIALPTGDAWHWMEPCLSISKYYFNENKIDSAKKYLNIALETANSIHSIEHLARVYELFAKVHESTGEYSKAISDIHNFKVYNDSLASQSSKDHLQNLRVEYESNRAREEETRVKTEKQINNLILISGGIITSIAAIAFILLIRLFNVNKKAAKEKEKIALERQEFYRGVTHQLRTPLTVVLGMAQQLRKFLPENDMLAKREFDAMNRQCQQLLNLVTEMIEYSKNGSTSNTPAISELSNNTNYADIDIPSSVSEEDEGHYILLAEDDPDVALLVTEMLKAEGYSYAWAKDGQEAWEMMHENMPELLITDIMMPRMDGLELMKKVRDDESINHLPIIVVSARVENEDRLIGFEAGAEVYLGKPFLPNELLIRIRKLLEQRQLLKSKFRIHIGQAAKDNHPQPTEPNVPNDTVDVVPNTPTEVAEESDETPETSTSANEPEQKPNEPKSQEAMSTKERMFLESVDSFIQKNLSNQNLSSATLADALNTTTSTLNRKLKNLTNIDTTHYIRMHRIAKAKDLLQNTDLAMMEIQIECGFDTPSYFSRTFKADVGVSPSEYRKRDN